MELTPDQAAAAAERHDCPACGAPAGSACHTRGGKTAALEPDPRAPGAGVLLDAALQAAESAREQAEQRAAEALEQAALARSEAAAEVERAREAAAEPTALAA